MVYVYHQFYGGFECSDKLKWYVIDLMDIDILLMYDDVLRWCCWCCWFCGYKLSILHLYDLFLYLILGCVRRLIWVGL